MSLKFVLLWSSIIASIGGIYGVVAPYYQSGIYSLAPPPVLGYPASYQSINGCSGGPFSVCPPIVQNSIEIASVDYAIWFLISFSLGFCILWFLRGHLGKAKNAWHAIPLALVVLTVALVSVTASFSFANGASFTELNYQMGPVAIAPMELTLYSGSPSSSSSQGGAHLDLIIDNFDGNSAASQFSVNVTGPDISQEPVPVYECSSVSACYLLTTIKVPAYTELELNGTASAFYLGVQIQKGAEYTCTVNVIGESMTDRVFAL